MIYQNCKTKRTYGRLPSAGGLVDAYSDLEKVDSLVIAHHLEGSPKVADRNADDVGDCQQRREELQGGALEAILAVETSISYPCCENKIVVHFQSHLLHLPRVDS